MRQRHDTTEQSSKTNKLPLSTRTHSQANDASKTKFEQHQNGTAQRSRCAYQIIPRALNMQRLATTARHHLPTHGSHRSIFATHGEQRLPQLVSTGARKRITVHLLPFDARCIQRRRRTSMPIACSCTTSRIVQKRFNIRNACLTCIIHSFPHPTFLSRIQSLRGSIYYSISFISYVLLV